ncbi:hypothetical protein [Glycomyces albidus]|uniref:DUF4386 family protein n=1 Tax=Glycomyces albidus TaxID=2656774 RepID=A0A6L5GEE7_9ACTN|nr:hypothetical protein [Glycomyces albidus]MQM28082.1 hypothetical protein [Glycomyces albidus]
MTLPRFTATCLLFAPIGILLGWAGMRLGGGGGAEPLWTVAHLFWLPSYAALAVGFAGIHRLIRPRRAAGRLLAGSGLAMTVIGGLAIAAQMVVDLVVGFATADRDAMGDMFDQVQSVPGVELAVYAVGPSLLFVGMLILVVQAAASRQVPARAAVLVSAAVVISGLEQAVEVPLRLMMLAAVLLLWLAAVPIARQVREDAAAEATAESLRA